MKQYYECSKPSLHSHWENCIDIVPNKYCANCGWQHEIYLKDYAYCPNCGAIMDMTPEKCKEKFLEGIECQMCGTQICDHSEELMEGCQKWKDFKKRYGY